MEATTPRIRLMRSRASFQSVKGLSSARVITTSALAPRIFVLRSASNPDITDRAMIGAAVPRNTPKMEIAVNTVKLANRTPR